MNDGVLVVNFAKLDQASADIGRAVRKMQTDLDALKQHAESLMSTWDGPARTAFEEGQKKWNAAATELSDVLLGIQRAVDASAGDYRNTETKAAGLFS